MNGNTVPTYPIGAGKGQQAGSCVQAHISNVVGVFMSKDSLQMESDREPEALLG